MGSFDSCLCACLAGSRPERQTAQHDGSFVFRQLHVPSLSDLFLSVLVVSVTSLITVSPPSIPRTLLFPTNDLICPLSMARHQQSELRIIKKTGGFHPDPDRSDPGLFPRRYWQIARVPDKTLLYSNRFALLINISRFASVGKHLISAVNYNKAYIGDVPLRRPPMPQCLIAARSHIQ